MKTNHTEGPWHTGDAEWRSILGPKTRRRNDDGRLRLINIATVATSDDEHEDIANARLIAAAPQMLEALESISSLAQEPVGLWSHAVLVNILRTVRGKAIAAITGASGARNDGQQDIAADMRDDELSGQPSLADAVESIRRSMDRLAAEKAALRSALSEACSHVEYLSGRDNSCDPGPEEDLKGWRKLL